MRYEMQELLQQTAWLAEQYTSKDASSITYETANMLMEAVLYCIEEYEQQEESGGQEKSGNQEKSGERGLYASAGRAVTDIKTACRRGYEAVLLKVDRTRKVYEALVNDFEDYGCRNYRDTVTGGISGFFIKYNAKFCPQDQILTLDYPVLGGNFLIKGERALCGIDLIYEYMKRLQAEKKFLDCFDRRAVVNLMNALYPEYEELYLDNLCFPVLLNASGCLIAGKPVSALEVGWDGLRTIENYFKVWDAGAAKEKLLPFIRTLTAGSEQFDKAADLYVPLIEHGIKFGRLDQIFQI